MLEKIETALATAGPTPRRGVSHQRAELIRELLTPLERSPIPS
jgi:hypothetical protein